jgi:hypothetical protein
MFCIHHNYLGTRAGKIANIWVVLRCVFAVSLVEALWVVVDLKGVSAVSDVMRAQLVYAGLVGKRKN